MKKLQIFDNWKNNTMGPVFKFQDQINKGIKPLIASQISIEKSLKPLLDLTVAFKIPKYTFPNFKPLEIQGITAINSLGKVFNINFGESLKRWQELPPKIREVLILLGMNGWYLDFKMSIPFILKLKTSIEKDNLEDLENALIGHFDDRLNQIEEAIVKRFPNREKIINLALSAHRRKEYMLSIPVLFAQADGICKEVFDKYFFIKKDRLDIDKNYIQHVATETFLASVLSPLSHDLPIFASKTERGIEFNELNRHMVLHGESLDYGTKKNSLKAISLINYIAHLPPA